MGPSKAALAHAQKTGGGGDTKKEKPLHSSLHNKPLHSSVHKSTSNNSLHGSVHNSQHGGSSGSAVVRMKGGLYASQLIEKTFANSKIPDVSTKLPKFTLSECEMGKFLGKGGFGTVKEVKNFKVLGADAKKGTKDDSEPAVQSRQFMAEQCIRSNGECRYAIKYVSPENIKDPAKFIQSITDFAIETRFLSAIDHPNIITIRANSSGSPFGEDYFFIMDRLFDILDVRIKKWSTKINALSGFKAKMVDSSGAKKNAILVERLEVVVDLCGAIRYLNSLNILYRDIKPLNVGFDHRGIVKLFDFGLAKELTSDIKRVGDGLYKLSGMTGSPRYMAPEVGCEKPYNEKCDVYSMAILLWQILACKEPFDQYTSSKALEERVYKGTSRPPLLDEWSKTLRKLLQDGWTADIKARPTMQKFEDSLKSEIDSLGGSVKTTATTTKRTFGFLGSGRKSSSTDEMAC